MVTRMSNKFRIVAISLLSCLSLSACGEGWEVVQYQSTPYGDDRTAGSGVAYVIARMAPPREEIAPAPRLQETSEKADELLGNENQAAPIPEPQPEPAPAPEVKELKSAEPIFDNAQKK